MGTKWISVYFRSGRVLTTAAPDNQPDPEQYVSEITRAWQMGAEVMAIGPHLIFAKEVERMEFLARSHRGLSPTIGDDNGEG
jgi:hypothetical protein